MACARSPTADQLRDAFLPGLSRLSLGIVAWTGDGFSLGPVQLLRFGPPETRRGGWSWPIQGGLLAARAGGWTGVGSRPGQVFAYVEDYAPRLPGAVYRLTQLRVHRLLTRVFLLQQRGRRPPPGVPGAPAARIAAAAVDLGLCAALAATAGRGRRLQSLLLVAGAYHVAFWSRGGRTPGHLLLGLRVVSIDGSGVSAGQALLRLLALPRAVRELRAAHDELAATEVIAARP